MMWWTMAGCLLLVVAIPLLSGKNLGSSNWLLLGFLVICVGGHALMMRGMHNQKGPEDKHEEKPINPNQHHH